MGYKPFVPPTINHDWVFTDPRINELLKKALHKLGKLNAFSQIVPDADTFILLLIKANEKRKVQRSNCIERKQTNLEGIQSYFKEEIICNSRQEVQNYITAVREATQALKTSRLSNQLLCNAHKTLMQDMCKNPGEWREIQNWIGGSSLENAKFIPPPPTEIPRLMSDLEKFWYNGKIHTHHLIRIAISY